MPTDVPGITNLTSYNDYSQDHAYEHDLGVVVLPIASRTAGHRTIRLHGGYALRRVKWAASRSGKPPLIPIAQDTPTDRLLASNVHAQLPLPQPQSGTYQFSLSGEYLYVQSTPRVAGVNALPTGAYPFPVDPMDSLADSVIGPAVATSHTDVTTVAGFDAAITVADNAARSGMGSSFTWPLTAIPASFAGPLIT